MTLGVPVAPSVPIDVELYAGGDWRTVNGDVLWRSPMQISYGPPNEAPSVQPCSLTGLLLDNRPTVANPSAGSPYDPANPVGPYYGTIGRNTPVRVSIRSDVDSFSRTVANDDAELPVPVRATARRRLPPRRRFVRLRRRRRGVMWMSR